MIRRQSTVRRGLALALGLGMTSLQLSLLARLSHRLHNLHVGLDHSFHMREKLWAHHQGVASLRRAREGGPLFRRQAIAGRFSLADSLVVNPLDHLNPTKGHLCPSQIRQVQLIEAAGQLDHLQELLVLAHAPSIGLKTSHRPEGHVVVGRSVAASQEVQTPMSRARARQREIVEDLLFAQLGQSRELSMPSHRCRQDRQGPRIRRHCRQC
mmetsp:Transcript_97935/g.258688  ORF Transcript_97935/g.258688 Transcript_97935/m.258688 type:complete len:211 (-) Transcript_97935:140-772(-)